MSGVVIGSVEIRDLAIVEYINELRAERDALRAEVGRLKSLISRYAKHVDDAEGSDFLDYNSYGVDILSKEDREEIASMKGPAT